MNFHLHRFDYYPNTNTPLGHNFVWPKLPAFEHEKYIKLGIKDMLAYCILGKVCHYVVCVCVSWLFRCQYASCAHTARGSCLQLMYV